VKTEVHQFGWLGQPFDKGKSFANDLGGAKANHEFQYMIGLKRALDATLYHWTMMEGAPLDDPEIPGQRLYTLNGGGFIRLILDQYQGAHMVELTAEPIQPTKSSIMAVAIVKGPEVLAIIISNFNPYAHEPAASLSIKLPSPIASGLQSANWNYLRYSNWVGDNVYSRMRADLLSAGILRSEFSTGVCESPASFPFCVSTIKDMNTDGEKTRSIFTVNWDQYVKVMQSNLRWRAIGQGLDESGVRHDFKQTASELAISLSSNETIILKP
jgi:hypothetical protein